MGKKARRKRLEREVRNRQVHERAGVDLVFDEGLEGEFRFDYLKRGWSEAAYQAHLRDERDPGPRVRVLAVRQREA